jgi:hypothetical protein
MVNSVKALNCLIANKDRLATEFVTAISAQGGAPRF